MDSNITDAKTNLSDEHLRARIALIRESFLSSPVAERLKDIGVEPIEAAASVSPADAEIAEAEVVEAEIIEISSAPNEGDSKPE